MINKPPGITSFGCIRKIKKIIEQKGKIGHAGTLDPFAQGLLIVAISRQATRNIHTFMQADKEYIVKAKLGELSDTLDVTSRIIKTADISGITKQDLVNAIETLGTSYIQTPPIYSALRYKGTRLYEFARKQKLSAESLLAIAQQKQKRVQLYALELLECALPYFTLRAHVSHGTYIRSLINDIAAQCRTFATTYELTRTKIGPIALDQAIDLDTLQTSSDVQHHLISLDAMLKQFQQYAP